MSNTKPTLPPIPKCSTPEQQAYLDAVVEFAERDGRSAAYRMWAAMAIFRRALAEMPVSEDINNVSWLVKEALRPRGVSLGSIELRHQVDHKEKS